MVKKMKAFKGGDKIKRYAGESDGSYVEEDGEDIVRKTMRDRDAGSAYMNNINADVRRALAGERPPPADYTELPEQTKFEKVVNKIKKSQRMSPRDLEAQKSRGMPAVDKSIPTASATSYKESAPEEKSTLRKNFPGMASIYDYYASPSSMEGVKRNISNTAAALTPMGGGAGKIGAELALGNRAKQAASGAEKLSPAGQRLKNMEEVRNVAFPGRREAVMNPMAHAGGPKMMEKVAAQEAQAVRAAQAAAKKKAAQAKRDAKDPVMSARPGADKAKSTSKYETDEPMSISFGYKDGGKVKKFAKGGSVSSASSRADGCAVRGKTKGTISKMKSGGMYGGKGAC